MIPVLYTTSEKLKENLDTYNRLRESILSTPIDPTTALRLLAEGKAAKTYYPLFLSQAPLSRTDVVQTLLKPQQKKKRNEDNEDIVKYSHALSQMKRMGFWQNKEFTPQECLTLYRTACFGDVKNGELTDLKHILGYVQISREHPLVKAALAFILCFKVSPFTQNSRRFAHLLFEFFLVRERYDASELFCIDHYFADHKDGFQEELDNAFRNENLTSWLEYVSSCAVEQLRFVQDVIQTKGTLFRTGLPRRFWHITRRQQSINSLSLIPQAQLTNKKVQRLFGVSQITASRDLSKLAIVGLLQPHGSGRSAYYTAV